MKSLKRRTDKAAAELIEESVHLLRRAPGSTLAIYYLGALPFVLAAFFFWADMSRDPFAERRLAGAALGLACLFVWMKGCQTLFTRRLRALASRRAAPESDFFGVCRIFISQAALQPTGLFLLPLASIFAFPFGWVYAFYQHLTSQPTGKTPGIGSLIKHAQRQAMLWPKQNHTALAMLFGFGLFVFLNWCVAGLVLPGLVRTLFGVESIFARSGLSLLNTTFFAVAFGLTYLCVDPIIKAMYTLRSFYGEAQESGEDLKAELRSFSNLAGTTPAILALILTFSSSVVQAQAPNSPAAGTPPRNELSVPDLEQNIREVLKQRKYTWRMPRETVPQTETEHGMLARLRAWLRDVRDWLRDWLERLFRNRGKDRSGSGSGHGWLFLLQLLLYGLVAGAVIALLWLVYRILRGRKQVPVLASSPIQPMPDVGDENVGAEHLPEDGWSKLGRDLLSRGELRLAMRAFYLASLAHLAGRNLVSLAKFKSNRDYEWELRRRGHSFPELLELFGENVLVFDRTWYGMHELTEELVNQFIVRVEQLRGSAPAASAS